MILIIEMMSGKRCKVWKLLNLVFTLLGCPKQGYYGKNCALPCPANCLDGVCQILNGTCFGCSTGYKGTMCEKGKFISIKTIRHLFLQCIILELLKCTHKVYLCLQLFTNLWIFPSIILFSIKSCWVVRIENIYSMNELNTVDIRYIIEYTFKNFNFKQNVYCSLTW